MVMVLLAVLLVALGSSGWMAFKKQEETILKEVNRHGADITHYVSRSLAFSVVGYDYQTIQLLLNELITFEDVVSVSVTNAKGKTMGEASKAVPDGSALVIFKEPIRFDNEVVGNLTVGLTTHKIIEDVEQQKESLIKREAVLILLIALGEFMALSYLIVRPVRVISRALQSNVAADGEINGDIDIHSYDEFGELATRFNTMRIQLNNANHMLHAKIEASDQKLRDTNYKLIAQQFELKRINEELKVLSVTDELTGLYNRRQLDTLLRTEVSLALRHGIANSLLIIDIDFFKHVNDAYGHDVGDAVLREVAQVLRQQVRKTDLLCRVGGEEFVVLCKRADIESSLVIAEKLRHAIEYHAIEITQKPIKVTVSIGAATLPNDYGTANADELYKLADTALYFSKQHGRNRSTHYRDTLPVASSTISDSKDIS